MISAYAAAQFWIGLFAILVIYRRCICRQRAERCRSDIRAIRDDLFDFMWRNGYEFTSPAYQQSRRIVNGLLRLTTVIGPIQLLVLVVRCGKDKAPACEVASLRDEALKQKLRSASDLATRRFLRFLFLEGATGMLVRCLSFTFRAMHFFQRATKWIIERADLLREMAAEFGQEDLTQRQRALIRSIC